jgi:hypothetical protein
MKVSKITFVFLTSYHTSLIFLNCLLQIHGHNDPSATPNGPHRDRFVSSVYLAVGHNNRQSVPDVFSHLHDALQRRRRKSNLLSRMARRKHQRVNDGIHVSLEKL